MRPAVVLLSGLAPSLASYGLWRARPVSFSAPTAVDPSTRFVFAALRLDDGGNETLTAALDVKAPYGDGRVAYWLVPDVEHGITAGLEGLAPGWHDIPSYGDGVRGLDVLRDGIVDVNRGRLARYTGGGGGGDEFGTVLAGFFGRAVRRRAEVFVFGVRWGNGTGPGVQSVHVNQGHPRGGGRENEAGRDGGVLVRYGRRWEGLFVAFGGQAVETDGEGEPVGSETFATLLEGERG